MSVTLDIDLLRNFAAISDCGTIVGAAVRVGRTQSALSMQMKRLEDAVEQPLFHRTGRGVSLTPAGERLREHAAKLLRVHDEALADLSPKPLSGTLRLGCPDDYAVVFLPQLLHSFAQAHPQVLVEVQCAPTPRLAKLLERHSIDVALISLTEGIDRTDVIRVESLVWAGLPDGRVARLDPLPVALGEHGLFDHQAPIEALERAGRHYRIAYTSGSLLGLLGVVRSGRAVAVLTATAVPEDLCIVSPDACLPALPRVGITVAFDREAPSAVAAAFGQHVARALPTIRMA